MIEWLYRIVSLIIVGIATYAVVHVIYFLLAVGIQRSPPEPLSKEEYQKLDRKYGKYINAYHGFAIVGIFAWWAILFWGLNGVKEIIQNIPPNTVYNLSPTVMFLMVAIFGGIGTFGWIIDFVAHKILGKEFGVYYDSSPWAGYNTGKVYAYLSALLILISMPFAVLGFQDYAVVTSDGIQFNQFLSFEVRKYAWTDVKEIVKRLPTEKNDAPQYRVAFTDGIEWAIPTELWRTPPKKVIVQYIQGKTFVTVREE